jgi:hypothetical protein
MWATFIRLATVLERDPFDPVIDRLPGACSRRPRIEGLSLDRQEKRITFFRILPSKLITKYPNIRPLRFISISNVIIFLNVGVVVCSGISAALRLHGRV